MAKWASSSRSQLKKKKKKLKKYYLNSLTKILLNFTKDLIKLWEYAFSETDYIIVVLFNME